MKLLKLIDFDGIDLCIMRNTTGTLTSRACVYAQRTAIVQSFASFAPTPVRVLFDPTPVRAIFDPSEGDFSPQWGWFFTPVSAIFDPSEGDF